MKRSTDLISRIIEIGHKVRIPPGKAVTCDYFDIPYIKEEQLINKLVERKKYLQENRNGNWIDRVHEIDLILDYINDGDAYLKLMKENRNDK